MIARTTALFCLLAAAGAHAQTYEFSIMASRPSFSKPLLGTISTDNGGQDNDVTIKGKYGYGGRITLNTKGYYGHEIGYTLADATVTAIVRPDANTATPYEGKMKVQEAFYNFLIYFMPSRERWRPFITGGLQAYRYTAPHGIPDFPTGKSQTYGANWGGGLKVNLFPHALVRWDFRDYIGGKPFPGLMFKDEANSGGFIHDRELSMGLGITF